MLSKRESEMLLSTGVIRSSTCSWGAPLSVSEWGALSDAIDEIVKMRTGDFTFTDGDIYNNDGLIWVRVNGEWLYVSDGALYVSDGAGVNGTDERIAELVAQHPERLVRYQAGGR